MSHDYKIRPATAQDIPKIIELAVDLVVTSRSPYREGVSDEKIRSYRRQNFEHLASILDMPDGGLFVANDEQGEHIGHILLLCNQIDSVAEIPQAWVYDVSVRPDWWGRGVGQRLMAHGETFARQQGLEYIGLGVTAGNERAVKFYRDQGYGVERVQMIKRLS